MIPIKLGRQKFAEEMILAIRRHRKAFGDLPPVSSLMEWHIITPEYPPQTGGVSDYTRLVAEGLAEKGDVVHVWCPARVEDAPRPIESLHQITLHCGQLRSFGKALDDFARSEER